MYHLNRKTLSNLICKTALLTLLTGLLISCTADKPENNTDKPQTKSNKLVVYSSRKEHLIKPAFDLYTEQTGVKIEYLTDKAGVLIERIKAEGETSQADILITVDAGNLGHAKAQGLFKPLNSNVVNNTVADYLKDNDDTWTGLSLRARTIVYNTVTVKPEELSTYEALGSKQWQGKLCLRTSKKVYNQSLVASLISEHGETEAEAIVSGWINNLAIQPTSNDTKVMEAIIAGVCDVGIVNSYYFGRLQTKTPDLPLALFWPNQQENGTGVHVNVAGAGILKHTKNAEAAKALIEWLLSPAAQAIFAGAGQEYPINENIPADPQVSSWGNFKNSTMPLSQAYKLQPEAVKLMDRVGYK